MSVVVANSLAELQDIIASNENVVVDFHAISWCVPCQRLQPVFHKGPEQVKDVVFVEVDIDAVEGVSEEFSVMSVPTVLFFKNGEQKGSVTERAPIPFFKAVESLKS